MSVELQMDPMVLADVPLVVLHFGLKMIRAFLAVFLDNGVECTLGEATGALLRTMTWQEENMVAHARYYHFSPQADFLRQDSRVPRPASLPESCPDTFLFSGRLRRELIRRIGGAPSASTATIPLSGPRWDSANRLVWSISQAKKGLAEVPDTFIQKALCGHAASLATPAEWEGPLVDAWQAVTDLMLVSAPQLGRLPRLDVDEWSRNASYASTRKEGGQAGELVKSLGGRVDAPPLREDEDSPEAESAIEDTDVVWESARGRESQLPDSACVPQQKMLIYDLAKQVVQTPEMCMDAGDGPLQPSTELSVLQKRTFAFFRHGRLVTAETQLVFRAPRDAFTLLDWLQDSNEDQKTWVPGALGLIVSEPAKGPEWDWAGEEGSSERKEFELYQFPPDEPLLIRTWPRPRSRAVGLTEPAKVRVVTPGSALHLAAATPFQLHWSRGLSTSPVFVALKRTIDESDIERVQQKGTEWWSRLGVPESDLEYCSVDYKGATDLLALQATQTVKNGLRERLQWEHTKAQGKGHRVSDWDKWAELFELGTADLQSDIQYNSKQLGGEDAIIDLLQAHPGKIYPVSGVKGEELREHPDFVFETQPGEGAGARRRRFRKALGRPLDSIVVHQSRGQLMASKTSFPILCICNYLTYVTAFLKWSRESGVVLPIDMYSDLMNLESPVLVNGDDMLYRAPRSFYRIWAEVSAAIGFKLSAGKNFVHRDVALINSQLYNMKSGRPVRTHATPVNLVEKASSQTGQREWVTNLDLADRSWLVDSTAQNKIAMHALFVKRNSRQLQQLSSDGLFNFYIPKHLGGLGLRRPVGWRSEVTRLQGAVALKLYLHHTDTQSSSHPWSAVGGRTFEATVSVEVPAAPSGPKLVKWTCVPFDPDYVGASDPSAASFNYPANSFAYLNRCDLESENRPVGGYRSLFRKVRKGVSRDDSWSVLAFSDADYSRYWKKTEVELDVIATAAGVQLVPLVKRLSRSARKELEDESTVKEGPMTHQQHVDSERRRLALDMGFFYSTPKSDRRV